MVKQTTLFTSTASGFYNTTNLKDDELKERQMKSDSQEAIVLNYFTMHPPYKFSASQVTSALHTQGHKFIKDSVKRAMSNLCSYKIYNTPFLVRTKERVMGEHGMTESVYKIIR